MDIIVPAEEKKVSGDDIYRVFPAQEGVELNDRIFLILAGDAGGAERHGAASPQDDASGGEEFSICGAFTNPEHSHGFEYFEPSSGDLAFLEISRADIRFKELLEKLGKDHIYLKISGIEKDGEFFVNRMTAEKRPGEDSPFGEGNDELLRFTVNHIRTSFVKAPEKEIQEELPLTELDDMKLFLECASGTLPANIRRWARRNIKLAEADSSGAEEKRHAKIALSMILNIKWKSSEFEPVDPVSARRILDEELFGLDAVKQRVIETIIQINRTHTLPAYGILLVGPAGTGKSRIAYAVAKILKIPYTVLDMSSVRDPEALTGTSRIYTNARPGRIMEAFSQTGSSNIVFIINELDKADREDQKGNPADTLLTLLDNLGYTDNYIECQIPTGGVYPIATANDKSRISDPLISRFTMIEIPDYTPEEKEIIFRNYSLPRVLKRMGMMPQECRVTEEGTKAIIELYKDLPGCRALEQAAEHLAGNALYQIETTNKPEIEFGQEDIARLLGNP
ncbi:MAG: AAA family ATPase [Lachnospiraceae bacterium]|nr:AAA family ATPase [Lachnospiraceae bacterium]